MGIGKLVDAHGMTREGASSPTVAFVSLLLRLFSCLPSASIPHFLSTSFASRISHFKTMETARTPNCKPRSANAAHRPARTGSISSVLCPAVALAALGGLCRFSCAVLLVQFGFFFSRSPQQHMPAVVISNPISAPFHPFFLSPVVTISSHGITTHGHVLFLFPFSFIVAFPSKQELGKFYFYFFLLRFFVYASVPSIRNRNRTSYL